MDFFSRMFSSMFRSSANRFKDRAVAQVRRNTVGKVQAKAMSSMSNLDKKMYGAADNLTGMDKNKKQAGGGGGGGGAGGGGKAGGAGGGGGG
ncbi:MAG: hypothetical protein IKY83_13390, partial [Proteobacteria bacterium]|nr:hypothetical protein [Pseudomonadota bacterium]